MSRKGGERGEMKLSRVGKGIMRSGVFKRIRKEIKNSVCVCVWRGARKQKGGVRKIWGGDGRER